MSCLAYNRAGGLGVPQIWLYYLASRFIQQAQWTIRKPKVPWVRFEQDSILPFHLPGLLWFSCPRPPELAGLNLVVAQGVRLWSPSLGLVSGSPPGASFLGDFRFPSAFTNPGSFGWWTGLGLTTLEDLQHKGKFMSFSLLQSLKGAPLREFYKYMQIQHFFLLIMPLTLLFHTLPSSPFVSLVLGRKALSPFYTIQ